MEPHFLQLNVPLGSKAIWHISPGLRQVRSGEVKGATYSIWLRITSCDGGDRVIIALDDTDVRFGLSCAAGTYQ